jgi:hypothetical protein
MQPSIVLLRTSPLGEKSTLSRSRISTKISFFCLPCRKWFASYRISQEGATWRTGCITSAQWCKWHTNDGTRTVRARSTNLLLLTKRAVEQRVRAAGASSASECGGGHAYRAWRERERVRGGRGRRVREGEDSAVATQQGICTAATTNPATTATAALANIGSCNSSHSHMGICNVKFIKH